MQIIDKTSIKYRFNRLSPKVQLFMKLPYDERKDFLKQKYIIEEQSISKIARSLEDFDEDYFIRMCHLVSLTNISKV